MVFQRSTVVLCALEERFYEPFASMSQLRGRCIGVPSGTKTGLGSQFLLEQAGPTDAVDVIDLGGESGRLSSPDPSTLSLGRSPVGSAEARRSYVPINKYFIDAQRTDDKLIVITELPDVAAEDLFTGLDKEEQSLVVAVDGSVITRVLSLGGGWSYEHPNRPTCLRNRTRTGG